MSAFDALTKIKQAVTHPKTDHQLPKSRSLAFKAITDKAALQGTKGQHCTLVHGDHWNEVKGNEVSNVKLDQKLTVSRHQTIKVVGNHKETLVGKVYQNVIGPHIVQNNAVRNETRLSSFNLVYGDFEQHDDADGHLQQADVLMECTWYFNGEYTESKLEITPVHLELKVAHLTLDLIDVSGALANVQSAVTAVSVANTSLQLNTFQIQTTAATNVHIDATTRFWLGLAAVFGGVTVGPNSIL